MKKILSSSLIAVVLLANFLAPVSFAWENNKIQVKKSVVSAKNSIDLTLDASSNDTSITADVEVHWSDAGTFTNENVSVVLFDENRKEIKTLFVDLKTKQVINDSTDFSINTDTKTETGSVVFNENIEPETLYFLTSAAIQSNGSDIEITGKSKPEFLPVPTRAKGEAVTKHIGQQKSSVPPLSSMPECSTGYFTFSVSGCFAQFLYYAFFVPSSFLFALSGTLFDNTFAYSVQPSSYASTFVIEGWNVVRDFVNMFFIFVLLYIAFSTILNLNGAKTKEMIINVIIIGLLINFSLFATRVIIDTSNILARVFYNSNTIKITAIDGPDTSKIIANDNKNGVIPLSVALVNKVNPQSIILNAEKVGDIRDDAGQGEGIKSEKTGVSTSTFILITLLASAVNIVGFIVFLSVGLMFIVRVVGLWLMMILAPFAFFSYTVPAMQGIEMVGWKKWWPELIKLAFMAPVFIFFMYLILKFLNTGLGVMDSAGVGNMNFILRTMIPFAFIMVLLMKAKDIAIKMSGEMGSAVSKAGSAIGGLAIGAATGGASMAMRRTIGKRANDMANSEQLKENKKRGGFRGFAAKMQLKTAGALSKSSFDVRNTKLGLKAGKGLGVDLGKAKEGGYAGYEDRRVEKKIKDIKSIELSKADAVRQDEAARNDPTHKTLNADQENQRRRREYAENMGEIKNLNNIDARVSSELTKGQLKEEDYNKTKKALTTVTDELDEFKKKLKRVAGSLGIDPSKVKESDIKEHLNKEDGLQDQLTYKEGEITKWTAKLENDPDDPAILPNLIKANKDKRKLKQEISDISSLLNDIETTTNRKEKLKEKLKSK